VHGEPFARFADLDAASQSVGIGTHDWVFYVGENVYGDLKYSISSSRATAFSSLL